jgi:hypothetical protein
VQAAGGEAAAEVAQPTQAAAPAKEGGKPRHERGEQRNNSRNGRKGKHGNSVASKAPAPRSMMPTQPSPT